jgi:hypothetical protein
MFWRMHRLCVGTTACQHPGALAVTRITSRPAPVHNCNGISGGSRRHRRRAGQAAASGARQPWRRQWAAPYGPALTAWWWVPARRRTRRATGQAGARCSEAKRTAADPLIVGCLHGVERFTLPVEQTSREQRSRVRGERFLWKQRLAVTPAPDDRPIGPMPLPRPCACTTPSKYSSPSWRGRSESRPPWRTPPSNGPPGRLAGPLGCRKTFPCGHREA